MGAIICWSTISWSFFFYFFAGFNCTFHCACFTGWTLRSRWMVNSPDLFPIVSKIVGNAFINDEISLLLLLWVVFYDGLVKV